MLGVENIDSSLRKLDTEQLRNLCFQVDRLMQKVEHGREVIIYEAALPLEELTNVKASYFKKMDSLTRRLQSGKDSLAVFEQKVAAEIEKNFTKAYKIGYGRKLLPGDMEYIRRAVKAELEYAKGFGQAIRNKTLRMSRLQRVGMYAKTLDGIAWNGNVEAQPDNVEIEWTLGGVNHCDDCVSLALSGPYTKNSLPATPGDGGTTCRSNCQCKLVYRVLPKKDSEDPLAYGNMKNTSMMKLLQPPLPPRGTVLPTMAQRAVLDSMWTRLNYNRRMASQFFTEMEGLSKGSAEYEVAKKGATEAIAARKKANQEIIAYLEKHGIHDVPLWTVDEIITGSDIGYAALGDISEMSVETKAALDKAIRAKLGRFSRETKRAYSEPVLKQIER